MKILMIMCLAAVPVSAASPAAETTETLTVPIELDSSSFNDDVESASEKIRRLIWESKKEKYFHDINSVSNNPEVAQKALDALERDYPELKKEQPRAFEFQHGRVELFKKNYKGAYGQFNTALATLESKYEGGIPPRNQYYEINASFMSDLYMGRGVSLMCMGRDEEALKDMNRAIFLSPKARAYMQAERARALIRLKRYQEAVEAYNSACSTDLKWAVASDYHPQICGALLKKGFKPSACVSAN